MKNARSLLLLIVSFLLFVVSFVLLWTWGYRVYIKTPGDNSRAAQVKKDPDAVSGTGTRDSLQTVYTATINQLDSRLDATWNSTDSLKNQLDTKLGEFYRLRNEIALILKDHDTDANLGVARQKIELLQQKVKDLLNKNTDVENENKKLAAVLEQLNGNKKNPELTVQRVSYDNSTPAEKNNADPSLTVSELHLSAMMTENDKELETTQAQQTQKLVGSFTVKNNGNQFNAAELVVVVLQPDGQVIKNSAWESGTFNTSEGKKIYSYKMHFDNNHGEPKHLLFSLNADKYQKGNYTMQVYFNGTLVGKLLKTLS
jgi:regulator of replication initiation timing